MIWADLIPLVIATIYVVVVFIISEKVLKTKPEVSRKFLHIMIGNLIFIMPFFSDVWGMLILTVPTTIVLFFLTDYSPIKIENKVTESGHVLGLFFYALIWSVLLFIFNGNSLWIVAMAIAALVYGDGFAALIGSKFGRIKYTIWGGEKSLEGSLAMFLPTFNFWAVLGISAVATVCEAVSYGGIDNITVPGLTAILYYVLSIL